MAIFRSKSIENDACSEMLRPSMTLKKLLNMLKELNEAMASKEAVTVTQ